ncbi:hypothetical protein RIF29_38298 [Crotalaria pallida]|uniref:Uncharacterized protein n=1 Tax=Crotalaria pallida TaxID=3830 RepID=A0AAN9DZP1_CROPI
MHTFPFFFQPLPPRSSSPAAAVRFSLRFVCFVSSLTAGRTPLTHPHCCRASHRHRRRPAIVAPHAATIVIHSAVVNLSLRNRHFKLHLQTSVLKNCDPYSPQIPNLLPILPKNKTFAFLGIIQLHFKAYIITICLIINSDVDTFVICC